MATKRICDICEQPATTVDTNVVSMQELRGLGQTRIELRLGFGFTNHPTGFGGPPDLCTPCRNKLITELAETLQRRAQREDSV